MDIYFYIDELLLDIVNCLMGILYIIWLRVLLLKVVEFFGSFIFVFWLLLIVIGFFFKVLIFFLEIFIDKDGVLIVVVFLFGILDVVRVWDKVFRVLRIFFIWVLFLFLLDDYKKIKNNVEF